MPKIKLQHMHCVRCGRGYGDTAYPDVVTYCRECVSRAHDDAVRKHALHVERERELPRVQDLPEGREPDPSALARIENVDAQLATFVVDAPTPRRVPDGPLTEYRRAACGTCCAPLGFVQVDTKDTPSPLTFCDPDCEADYFAAGVEDPKGVSRVFNR